MKLVIAQMKHETNTFSPVPTPLARFAHGRPLPPEGQDVYDAFKGTGTAIGAFIDLAGKAGAEVVYPIAGNAAPSAPVENEAYEAMAGRIVEAVAKGCDAVLLDLHGAMVAQNSEEKPREGIAREFRTEVAACERRCVGAAEPLTRRMDEGRYEGWGDAGARRATHPRGIGLQNQGIARAGCDDRYAGHGHKPGQDRHPVASVGSSDRTRRGLGRAGGGSLAHSNSNKSS